MSVVISWETNTETSDYDCGQSGAVTPEYMNGSENFILKSRSSPIKEESAAVIGKSNGREGNTERFDGYKNITTLFLEFEELVHEEGECIEILTNTPESYFEDNVPHLAVAYVESDGNKLCTCAATFHKYMIDIVLSGKTEEKIVHTYKTYLQGHVQDKKSDRRIKKFINELQDTCLAKKYALLAGCTFQTHMNKERLKTLLSKNFEEMPDKFTAVIIEVMDSKTVQEFFGENPDNHDMLHTIIKKRHKTLIKLLEKLVEHGQKDDSVNCKVLEMDGSGRNPRDDSDYDYAFYTGFQKIAFEGTEEAVCQKVVQVLIKEKWEKWCKIAFTIDACLYLLSVVFLTFVVVTGVSASQVTSYSSSIDYIRAVFEVILLVNALRILVTEMYQVVRLRTGYLVDKINFLDITASVLLILVLPMRYIHVQVHWYVFAAAYIAWLLQIIKYAPVFKFTGVYAEALQKMIAGDFLKFGILNSITIIIFSGTFLLVLKGENTLEKHNETKSFWSILLLGLRIMVEADSIVDYMGEDGYNVVGSIMMMMFMFFIIVVLLNILIAQLINTYQKIEGTSLKGFYVRRAKIIARLEREQMPLLNNEEKRRRCYEPEIKIDGKETCMADTAILNDDQMTILQNMEQSLKNAVTKEDIEKKTNAIVEKTHNIHEKTDAIVKETNAIEKKTSAIAFSLKHLEEHFMTTIDSQLTAMNDNLFMLRSDIKIAIQTKDNQNAGLYMEDEVKRLRDELQHEKEEKHNQKRTLDAKVKRLKDALDTEVKRLEDALDAEVKEVDRLKQEKKRIWKKRCLICKIKS